MSDDLEIRRATDADTPAVLSLLRASLKWGDDARYAALFEWKHRRNPFGPSPAWIALDRDRLVGFRTMVRWEFERDGACIRAACPVDTATHPEYQGRGLFTRLTLHALEELAEEGVELLFNTPNDQSRPGYLKMGWSSLGKLPAMARPTRLWRAPRMLRARVPADRWAARSDAGTAAEELLGDHQVLASLVNARTGGDQLRTRMTPAFLSWRYGDPLLGYRVVVAPGGPETGIAIFRVRHRGPAREAALCEVLVPSDDERTARKLTRQVVAEVDADYVLGIRSAPGSGSLWPVPGQGPVLAARTITGAPPPGQSDWKLTLGDVELF